MKRLLCGILAACVAAVALGTTVAQAQDKEKAKTETVVPDGGLTDELLKERLEAMGYDFKVVKSTGGTPMYLVDVTVDNFRYVFYVSLSADKNYLWISSALRQLPEGDKVRPDILEKLLAKQWDIGPMYFTLKSNRMLYLERGLENQGLTAKRLRQEITNFMGALRGTESLWNPEKYPAPEKVVTSK
jgi:hypothetical protein